MLPEIQGLVSAGAEPVWLPTCFNPPDNSSLRRHKSLQNEGQRGREGHKSGGGAEKGLCPLPLFT